MGIGAAIGGLADGFGTGLKLRSEMEDAKERRKLMGLQARAAQQQLDEGDEKANARREAQGLLTGYREGDASLGFVRNEDGSYDPNSPENLNRYYQLGEISAARMATAFGQNPAQAVAQFRELKEKQFQKYVNLASSQLDMGDFAAAEQTLKRAYPMYNDGRTFLGFQEDPSNPKNIGFRYRDDKTGEEKTFVAPKDKLGERIQFMGLNNVEAANLRQRQSEFATTTDQKNREFDLLQQKFDFDKKWKMEVEAPKVNALIGYYDKAGRAALMNAQTSATNAETQRGTFELQRTAAALNNQLTSVTTLLGIDTKFDPIKASKEQVAAHNEKLGVASDAMFLIAQGAQGGKLTVDAAKAIGLVREAQNPDFPEIQRAGKDMYFIQRDGVKVPVRTTDAEYNAAKARFEQVSGGGGPAPAGAPARGLGARPASAADPRQQFGVLTPRSVVEEQARAGNPNAIRYLNALRQNEIDLEQQRAMGLSAP